MTSGAVRHATTVAAVALAGLAPAGCGPLFGTGDAGETTSESVLEVEGASMEPTLHCARPGAGCRAIRADAILVRPVERIRRGDLVAFEVGEKARSRCGAGGLFVKRVIALAGQRVSFEGGRVLVDGRPLDEAYADGPTDAAGAVEDVVPPRHLFVLGDNRAQSCDSRIWGPLAARRIVGVAVAIRRGDRPIPLP